MTLRKHLLALTALALLAGCATTEGPVNPRDPYEPFNRSMFKFNDNLDRAVIKPGIDVYTTVIPGFARTWISNFFSNVGDVWIGANNLLQGKIDQAASDVARVLVNTTFGVAGLVDVATDMGLQHHNEDFGQTLGRWGVEPGPYLVLPVFGPRDVRDSFGLVADIYGNPIGYMHDVRWRNSLWALSFIDLRANLNDAQSLVQQAALDPYTFVREAYIQRRRNLVYDGDPPPLPPEPDDNAAPEPKDKTSQSQPPDLPPSSTGKADAPVEMPAAEPVPAVPAPADTQAPAAAPQPQTADAELVKPEVRRVVYPVEVPAIPDLVAERTTDRGASPPVQP